MDSRHGLRQVARRATGACPADRRAGLSALVLSAATSPQDPDPGVGPPRDLQREPGIVARAVLARRDHRVALPVLRPQAAADPPVVQRPGCATGLAIHVEI